MWSSRKNSGSALLLEIDHLDGCVTVVDGAVAQLACAIDSPARDISIDERTGVELARGDGLCAGGEAGHRDRRGKDGGGRAIAQRSAVVVSPAPSAAVD